VSAIGVLTCLPFWRAWKSTETERFFPCSCCDKRRRVRPRDRLQVFPNGARNITSGIESNHVCQFPDRPRSDPPIVLVNARCQLMTRSRPARAHQPAIASSMILTSSKALEYFSPSIMNDGCRAAPSLRGVRSVPCHRSVRLCRSCRYHPISVGWRFCLLRRWSCAIVAGSPLAVRALFVIKMLKGIFTCRSGPSSTDRSGQIDRGR
jgi:hypothetical protein